MYKMPTNLPSGICSTRNIKNWGRSGMRKHYHALALLTLDRNVARSPQLFILRDRCVQCGT
jgi:hypothetical protein